MNNMNTNTFNFGQTGLDVGTVIRYVDWTGSEDSRPRLVVSSKTTASPMFGDKTNSIKLNEASRIAFRLETGERLTEYMAMDMWETEEGTVLRQFVTDPTEFNGFRDGTRKSGKSPWAGNVHYKTVYSNLMTASDVVRSDIPTAVGYEPKASAMWNDYLDGGNGALSDRSLTNNLFLKGFMSDCCSAPSKTVAGQALCAECKGDFVSSVLEETS